MKKVIGFIIIILFLGMGSCKKKNTEPDVCGTNWAVTVSTKATAVYTTAVAYGTNATVANCNAYKTATQAYITALEPFSNCSLWAAQDKTAFQTAINEAKAELADINCQ